MAEARSPEEIAASVLLIDHDVELDGEHTWSVSLHNDAANAGPRRPGPNREGAYLHSFHSEQRARLLAAEVSAIIAHAIRQAMATALDDPPLSSERLEDIRLWQHWTARGMPQNAPPWPSHLPRHEMAGLLLELIDHLRAQVAWLAQDSVSMEAFEAGRRQERIDQLSLLKECRIALDSCVFLIYSQSDEYRKAAYLVRRLDAILENTP